MREILGGSVEEGLAESLSEECIQINSGYNLENGWSGQWRGCWLQKEHHTDGIRSWWGVFEEVVMGGQCDWSCFSIHRQLVTNQANCRMCMLPRHSLVQSIQNYSNAVMKLRLPTVTWGTMRIRVFPNPSPAYTSVWCTCLEWSPGKQDDKNQLYPLDFSREAWGQLRTILHVF